MAEPAVIDYYSVLNLPTSADFDGVSNAYARLSGELAKLGEVDPSCSADLQKLNAAYAVLSKPELRREYDRVFLAKQYDEADRRWSSYVRQRVAIQWSVIIALAAIVGVQATVLAIIAKDQVGPLLSKVFGPLG